MARKKTTFYIDESLLRAAKAAAARTGKRESDVVEEALRRHLGLGEALERIWSGIPADVAPSDADADRIAAEELAAVRAERARRKAG